MHHVTWETNNVRGGQFIKESTSSRRQDRQIREALRRVKTKVGEEKMKTTIIINRNDINTDLHPFIFDEWLEQLGLERGSTDTIELTVNKENK